MGLMMEKSFAGIPKASAADIKEWEAERREWQAIAGEVDAGKILSDILLEEIDKAIASENKEAEAAKIKEQKEIKKVKAWLRQNRTQPRVFSIKESNKGEAYQSIDAEAELTALILKRKETSKHK